MVGRSQGIVEIRQQILLLPGQIGGSFHMQLHQLIAFSAPFQRGKSFAFDAQGRAALRAFRHFHPDLRPRHRRNRDDSAGNRGRQRNRQLADQIEAIPLEHRMRAKLNDDIEIALRSAVCSGFAFMSDPELGTVVDTRRNADLEFPFHANTALPAARLAGGLRHLTAAPALRTRLRHAEQTGLHLALSAALRTSLFRDRRIRSAASACAAGIKFRDFERFFRPCERLVQRDLKRVLQICSGLSMRSGAPGPAASTEHILEEAGASGTARAAEHLTEHLIRITEILSTARAAETTGSAGPARAAGTEIIGTELIVISPFFRIAEHLIRLGNLLEFLLSGLVSRVLIGMILYGKLTVCLLDFLGCSGLCQSKYFIIIFVSCHFTVSQFSVPDYSSAFCCDADHIIKGKGIIAVVAAVVVGVSLSFLVDPVVGAGFSFTSVAIGAMIICVILMVPLVRTGKEYNTELKNVEGEKSEKYTLLDMWNCVKVNKYMMIYLLSTFIVGITATSTAVGSLISFYLFNGNTMITSFPVLIAFVPGIIISTQADKIAKRFGRRNSMILLGVVFGGTYIIQYIVGYENVTIFIILGIIGGLANALRNVFMNFIAPDTIEYTRYKTGKDCAGIFYSLNAFVTKAVGGLGSSIGLLVMGVYGWREVQAESYDQLLQMGMEVGQAGYQTPMAIHGMWVVYALIPGIGFLLSALTLLFYKLRDKDAELMAKCNSGEISRKECESQLSRKY